MRKILRPKSILLITLSFLHFPVFEANATQAQPVPIPEDQSASPEIEIAGVGSGTLDTGRSSSLGKGKTKSQINFSDSSLLIGAAQRLADGTSVGSMGLGWLTLDYTNTGVNTPFFLHEAFLDYQSEHFEALVGRSDNPTAHLVDFPTIRGDDLITLRNPMNPFSDGKNAEEHRYSNVASLTLNQGQKTFESVHIQHLVNSAGIGSEAGINSFGATFEYLSEAGSETFNLVPSFGFSYEHLILISANGNGLNQLSGGGTVNLNSSVTNQWRLDLQDIVSLGSDLKNLASVSDSYQANSNTATGSLRYLSRPFGKPGFQAALTAAFKNYFGLGESAKAYGGALTVVKRLGQGFDFVTQYLGQFRNRPLATIQSGGTNYEQTLQIGFVFNFDGTINEHLAPRRSILNQQHQYLPN